MTIFFKSFETTFVRWYNNKYFRSGHLFQDRFYSSAIESKQAFLSTLIYIHNNPVKANMCRYASEYRWSSKNAFYGAKNPLINVSYAYNIAGSKDYLLHLFAKDTDLQDDPLFKNDHRQTNHYLTDEKALDIFKSMTHLSSASDASTLEKSKRNAYIQALREKGLTVKQIARIMDISASTVKRICKMT